MKLATSFASSTSAVSSLSYFLFLLLLSLSCSFSQAQLEIYDNVCGDCWCIWNDGETDSFTECPAVGAGIRDSFPDGFGQPYATFELNTDSSGGEDPKLVDANGNACYPFADLLGELTRYPLSSLPQCVLPSEEGFCAYVYDQETSDTCRGRTYQMKTYATRDEADAAGDLVQVVHGGECGVCSNAQDMSVYIARLALLEDDTLQCATSYAVSPSDDRFETLTQCFAQFGFTDDCALLWAHRVAANAVECASDCIGNLELNGPAPQCALGACLDCGQDIQKVFDLLGGKTFVTSGLVDAVARPCGDYVRVEYDPCVGTNGTFDFSDDEMTDDDDSDGGATTTTRTSVVVTSALASLVFGCLALVFGI